MPVSSQHPFVPWRGGGSGGGEEGCAAYSLLQFLSGLLSGNTGQYSLLKSSFPDFKNTDACPPILPSPATPILTQNLGVQSIVKSIGDMGIICCGITVASLALPGLWQKMFTAEPPSEGVNLPPGCSVWGSAHRTACLNMFCHIIFSWMLYLVNL